MPDIPHAQLAALAQTGALNREIVAALGRPMTDEERGIVDRARVVMRLRQAQKRQTVKLGASDRHTVITAERSKVDLPPCADPARRKRLEADPIRWLKHYMAATYTRPFETPHIQIIDGTMEAHRTGGRFCVAAERGVGKSAVLWGMVLFLALSGQQRYPICVPWADKALKRAFRFWKMALCFNDALGADYPEACAPFRHARGVAQRVNTTRWRHTDEPTGAQLNVGEGIIVLPDQRGCIGGSTINGNVRGLNHPQEDGTVLRPTLVLLDDVQDRGTAKSLAQVRDTIDIIDGDVAGVGEAGTSVPILMSGNCIVPDDVMAHYLAHREWRGLRVPCVLQWPDGWEDEKSACRRGWERWRELEEGGSGAGAYYRKQRGLLTAGMRLSAPAAFRRSEETKDALLGAIRAYFRMGHDAFWAERQQEPQRRAHSIYVLTPALIESRADPQRAPGSLPEWVQTTVAATDVNPSYALTSAAAGFGPAQVGATAWYGTFREKPMPVPKEATEIEKRRIIYEALAAHGKQLAALPCRPALWIIDGGGSPEGCVIEFAANAPRICGLQAVCAFGRGWKTYRATSKAAYRVTPGEMWHRVAERRDRQWLIFHADYWREVAQRGWTGSPGAPGSMSLPKGNHADFALQVCREQLRGKDDVGGRAVWVWDTAPGPHDYGDCMTMLYVAASMQGIGTGGSGAAPAKRRARRAGGVQVVNI
jgi:hypothetical protein